MRKSRLINYRTRVNDKNIFLVSISYQISEWAKKFCYSRESQHWNSMGKTRRKLRQNFERSDLTSIAWQVKKFLPVDVAPFVSLSFRLILVASGGGRLNASSTKPTNWLAYFVCFFLRLSHSISTLIDPARSSSSSELDRASSQPKTQLESGFFALWAPKLMERLKRERSEKIGTKDSARATQLKALALADRLAERPTRTGFELWGRSCELRRLSESSRRPESQRQLQFSSRAEIRSSEMEKKRERIRLHLIGRLDLTPRFFPMSWLLLLAANRLNGFHWHAN